jgi:hypothetical protein
MLIKRKQLFVFSVQDSCIALWLDRAQKEKT